MADYYGAEIRIWPWPEDLSSVLAVADWLTENYGEIQAKDGSEKVGAPIVSQSRELTVEVEQAQYGVYEFLESGLDPKREPSLVDLLRDAGLSFLARDEGRYEYEGREVSWRPGLKMLRERPILPGGAVALAQRTTEELIRQSSDAGLEGCLRNYFASVEDYREPKSGASGPRSQGQGGNDGR